MSLLKKLAGETAIYGISSILSRLINWVILMPYFTKRAFAQHPGEYGVVSDLYTWIALLLVIFTYRMETAFFRYGRKKEDQDRSFSTASISLLVTTLVFTTFLLLLTQPVAKLLHYADHPEYIRWFVGIVAMDTLVAIPFARIRLENRPIRFAMIKIGGIVLNIIFLFLFLEACPWLINKGWLWFEKIYSADNRIAYVFIANFLASFFTLLILLPIYFKIKITFDKTLWKQMLAYALPLVISGLAAVVNSLIGIPMLRFLASDAAAGIFAAVSKLAVLMNLFTQAFNYASEPFFFRNADRDDSKEIYAQVAQAFAIVGSVVFLGIMLYLDVIQYFLGKNYREGLGILPILLIANLFLGLYYSVSIWFKLSDNTKFGGYIALGGSVITLLINYFFIPNPLIGYYAPAWAALICYGFMLAICYWLGQRYFPIRYPVKRILIYIGLALAGYALSWLLRQYAISNSLVIFCANTLIFGAYLFILFRMERAFIRSIFRQKG